MNRIEIIGLFTALDELCENEQIESVKSVIKAVLDEAKQKPGKKDKGDDD